MRRIKRLIYCLYRAGFDTVLHDGIEHAGYLAFLGLLALFPYLVFITGIAGLFGEDFAKSELTNYLLTVLPSHVTDALRPRMLEIISGPSPSLLTMAIVGAIWTASSGVEGARTILNRVYRVHTPPSYLFRRLMSVLQLAFLSMAVIVGMALLVIMPVIWRYLYSWVPFDFILMSNNLSTLGVIIGTILLFFVVSSLYYILPNVRQRWLSVFPGAAVTVIGWLAAAKLLAFYLAHFQQVNFIYGSLGGIIATLLFFYILGIIFIYGAEFSYLLKREAGEIIEEKETSPSADHAANHDGYPSFHIED